jgi:hypothetical protein
MGYFDAALLSHTNPTLLTAGVGAISWGTVPAFPTPPHSVANTVLQQGVHCSGIEICRGQQLVRRVFNS